jgi:thymidylate synthase
MYQNIYPFGYMIFGETIGEIWLSMITAILQEGEYSLDEGRKRKALQSVMLKAHYQKVPDVLIEKYGNKKNLDMLINLTFSQEEMWDFDVKPSFPPGSKSYYARLKEGKSIEFVIKRLTKYPESKKAVIIFPTYKDYTAVLENPNGDYLPCIVSIQYRITKRDGEYKLNALAYARSIDAYQKAYANLWVICMITDKITKALTKNLKREIIPGSLSIWIADAHIYEETEKEAEKLIKKTKEGVCRY